MRIKNLTSELQHIDIIDFEGDREFSITIEGQGETELVGAYVKNMHELSGILEIVGSPFVASPAPVVSETPQLPETPTLTEPDQPEVTQGESGDDHSDSTEDDEVPPTEDDVVPPTGDEVVGDKFICDECGAECASARGLSLHKSRAHQQ